MSGICLVAFHAECKVFTLCAIKAEHTLRDRFHALITAIPEIIPLFEKLILSALVSFLGHLFTHFFLEILLQFFVIEQVFMRISLNLLTTILEQLQVNRLVSLDLVLIFILAILVVLVVEHLAHGLIVNVWNELSIQFLLNSLNQILVLEQITSGQIVCLLQFFNDFFSFESL